MKHIVCLIACGVSCLLLAYPKSITPRDTMRWGLTDAQYEEFYAAHPTAKLSMGYHDYLALRYEGKRYHNLTNWFEDISSQQGAAELLIRQAATNDLLVAINRSLQSEVSRWMSEAEGWHTDFTNQVKVTQWYQNQAEIVANNVNETKQKVNDSKILTSTVKKFIIGLLDQIVPVQSN